MTAFMTDDFLLDTEFARRLYHDYAKDQPIFDYHCHLPPQQVAENYRFKNLYDIWQMYQLQLAGEELAASVREESLSA
jgi:glucuronate isomerase